MDPRLEDDGVIVTLLSNGSMSQYPENTLSTFSNRVPPQMFHGENKKYAISLESINVSTNFSQEILPIDTRYPPVFCVPRYLESYVRDMLKINGDNTTVPMSTLSHFHQDNRFYLEYKNCITPRDVKYSFNKLNAHKLRYVHLFGVDGGTGAFFMRLMRKRMTVDDTFLYKRYIEVEVMKKVRKRIVQQIAMEKGIVIDASQEEVDESQDELVLSQEEDIDDDDDSRMEPPELNQREKREKQFLEAYEKVIKAREEKNRKEADRKIEEIVDNLFASGKMAWMTEKDQTTDDMPETTTAESHLLINTINDDEVGKHTYRLLDTTNIVYTGNYYYDMLFSLAVLRFADVAGHIHPALVPYEYRQHYIYIYKGFVDNWLKMPENIQNAELVTIDDIPYYKRIIAGPYDIICRGRNAYTEPFIPSFNDTFSIECDQETIFVIRRQ